MHFLEENQNKKWKVGRSYLQIHKQYLYHRKYINSKVILSFVIVVFLMATFLL
jgi:hypothetical protein